MCKKLQIFILVVLFTISNLLMLESTVFAADYTIGTDETRTYKLVYDTGLSGYKLQMDDSGTVEWLSKDGSVGVRVISPTNVVSAFQYKAYTTVTSVNGGYKAEATVTTINGSQIKVTDFYKFVNGKLDITRDVEVLVANTNDAGYMVSLPVRTNTAIDPTSLKWFAPSAWYGNDSDNFTDRSKFCFKGTESSWSVDEGGAPLLANYSMTTLRGLTISDKTTGRRETIVQDEKPDVAKYLVDDRINLPGLGMRTVSGYTEVFHTYPGYTKNHRGIYTEDTILWRFIPVAVGNKKQVKIQINWKAYADFNTVVKEVWRDAYNANKSFIVDRRYDVRKHFDTIYEMIDKSYGTRAAWGYRPEYCTNFGDTNSYPSSGFLVRNMDLGAFMLKIGWEKNNATYRDHARLVVEDQIFNGSGLPNSGPDFGGDQWVRARCDSIRYALLAYREDYSHGVDHSTWWTKIVAAADEVLAHKNASGNLPYQIPGTDYSRNLGFMGVKLMVEMYNQTSDIKYKNAAIDMGNYSWNNGHSAMRFRNGIWDYGGQPEEHDREAGAVALEAYTSLYQLTSDTTWINRAKVAADFLETWQVIQDVNMVPYDTTGSESCQITMHNENIKPFGESYINAGSNGVDGLIGGYAPDFYIIYQDTGDTHYLDFARNALYNTTILTNMDDKSSMMSDKVIHKGAGFQNEFLVIGPDTYDNAVFTSTSRGRGHDTDMPWVPYEQIKMVQRIKELTGGKLDFDSTVRTKDVDNTSSSITYSGTWSHVSDTNCYNSTKSYSSTATDYFQYTFVGTDIAWYGQQLTNAGKADIYIDTVLQGNIDLYSSEAKNQMQLWKSPPLNYGSHTLKVVVRSDKNASSTGYQVNVDRLVTSINGADIVYKVNDSEPSIAYKGSFSRVSDASCYGGDITSSNITGDYIEFPFVGTEVAWYGKKASDEGKADVYVDNTYYATVDLYGSTAQYKKLLWRSPGLTNANHTLKIVVTGTKNASSTGYTICADRIEYVNEEGIMINEDEDSIIYSGTWSSIANNDAFDRAYKESQTATDYFEYPFSGSCIGVYVRKASDAGKADIYIDTVLQATVDAYSSTTQYNELLWSSGYLAPGEHTLKVVVRSDKNTSSTGYKVGLDTIVYAKGKNIALQNAGFEQADLTGWTKASSSGGGNVFADYAVSRTDIAHTGSYKGTVSDSAGTNGFLYKTVTGLTSGRTYRLGAWLETSPGRIVKLFVRNYGGAEKVVAVDTDVGYRHAYKEILFTAGSTSAEIGLHSPRGPGDSWASIDDIRLVEVCESGSVPNPATGVYEAEAAAISGGGAGVAYDHQGYSGDGFARIGDSVGGSITFTVNSATARNSEVLLRYSNGNLVDKTVSLYVNGSKVRGINLPKTGDWDTWRDKLDTVSLNAGSNTIAYKYDLFNSGSVNLDRITLKAVTKYEGESASLSGGTSVASDHTGYSGTGFVQGYTSVGATATFTVNAASAGNKDVELRFANDTGSTKTISIYVNGTRIKNISLPDLKNWDTWSYRTDTLSLNAGNNTIAYKYDSGDSGNVNLDCIFVP